MPDVTALLWEGQSAGLGAHSLAALGVAADLAGTMAGRLRVAAIRPTDADIAELGERGVDEVTALRGPAAGDLATAIAEALAPDPDQVIIVARGGQSLEVVPRLAARLGGAAVMGVTEVRPRDGALEAVAAVYGGAALATYRFTAPGPRCLGLGPASAEPSPRDASRTARVVEVEIRADPRLRVVSVPAGDHGPRLETARVVVSGGRGLRAAENFGLIRELALALGGLPGASRAIVDAGWAAPSEQVGLTGKVVAPDFYFAFGISGASQHMAGCSNAKTLIAVNTDPSAAIFKYAQFGVVGDCLELLPELICIAHERVGPS